jgi:hypothetical protein
VREFPRAAKPVREVVTSTDEEILEDHDVIEFQEPPQMTILLKYKKGCPHSCFLCFFMGRT